jgi:hypothetical protein
MKPRYLLWPVVCFFLCGCGHTVFLTGEATGLTAQNKFRIVHAHDDITFALGSETYTGRWIYMEQGGSVGFGTATAYSGGQTATANGMFVGLPTGGGGTYIGSAPDGSTLRCTFAFSEWNLKGLGSCHDSKGEIYDLQIS